jgi:hypothetical protein
MLFDFSWFRRRAARKQAQAQSRQRAKKRRMFLESLEGRRVLATLNLDATNDVFAYVAGVGVANNLSVSYDAGTQTYTFTDSAETITLTGDTGSFTVSGSGLNTVTVQTAVETDVDSLTISLDNSNDTAAINSINDPITSLSGGSGNDTLTGASGVWDFATTSSGTYTGAGATVTFTSIEVSIGGTGSDTLQGVGISSSVDLSALDANGADGAFTAGFHQFQNFETIISPAASVTLNGLNVASTWSLDGSPTYQTAGGTLNFSGFGTLQGNSDVDTFNVSAATAVTLRGGNGADLFNLSQALTGNILAEGGQDEINFSGSGQVIGNVSGGSASTAQLDFSGVAGPVTVTLTGVGTFAAFQGTASLIAGTFDNINDLIGSASGSDTLNGTNNAAVWTFGRLARIRQRSNARILVDGATERWIIDRRLQRDGGIGSQSFRRRWH